MSGPIKRRTTVAVLALRVAYGAGLVLAPTRLASRWLGLPAGAAPTQIPLRALGAREVVLHTGAVIAALRGTRLTPWLLGSVVGDLTDVMATAAGREQLPEGAFPATLAVGGGSALVSLGLVAILER